MKTKIWLTVLTIGTYYLPISVRAQDVLQKVDAVSIAMQNNFDIQIAKKNVEISANNASFQNSKFLPSLVGSAGANYSNTDGKVAPKTGPETEFTGNEAAGFNASIGIQYTVFDGFGRSNAYRKLQETYQISELQARQMVEQTLLEIFNSYYEIARLTQDVENQKQTLGISRDRLQRARYGLEYGQGTQLDVLNAEVDYNNDSITFLTNSQLLQNQKRNLNLLLGRDVNIDFSVDTTLAYDEQITLDGLLIRAKENNVSLLQQQRVLQNAEYDANALRSNTIPKLNISANYGWSENRFGLVSFVDQASTVGPNVGATLSWNIYDGGATNIKKQNAQIAIETQTLNLEKEQLNVQRNLANAWTAYQTALFVKNAQSKNLETAQTNFDRSVDQHKLGQITNIQFREAQINLLRAQLALNQAKYFAKNAELVVLQISGEITQAKF
jgi:outer membrane protein TolC